MSKVICVVGPTASGKTALAVSLALALNGEVISADSMQIYKGLNIGTAKPTPDEMRGVAHHMISVADPSEEYSVARYVEEADSAAQDITSRGKAVIICGGTGLYVDSFVRGLGFSNVPKDDRIRRRLSSLYDRYGADRAHRLLVRRDPEAASRVHPNDKKRVIRALEVSFGGGSISRHDRETSIKPPRCDALYLGLDYADRAKLYNRCNIRVDAMLEAGLLDEAHEVYEHADSWKTATSAIGYKELFSALDDISQLPEAVDNLKQATRRYAKRQLTWFRRNTSIEWFYPDIEDLSAITHRSTKIARTFMYNSK